MIGYVRRLINGPGAEELAARELTDARRQLLLAQSTEEYARSQVAYNLERIARLKAYMADVQNASQ